MTPLDAFIIFMMLILIAAVTALAYQRNNGHIDHDAPEPTVIRHLEKCNYSLKDAQQTAEFFRKSAEVWRDTAEKQKAIIEKLSAELKNRE